VISEVLAHSGHAADEPTHEWGELFNRPDAAVPTAVVKTDDSGVPAWALVAIALRVPFAVSGAHAAWQRRRARRHD
jgi:hypothetical protein